MTRATLEWVFIDNLLISFTSTGTVAAEDWERLIKETRAKSVSRWLALSVGATEMDSIKRKAGTDLIREKNIKVASITDDRLVRGLITAVGWLGAKVKAFSWAEVDAGIKYLDVPPERENLVRESVNKLRAKSLPRP
jgi:hypothetical protein